MQSILKKEEKTGRTINNSHESTIVGSCKKRKDVFNETTTNKRNHKEESKIRKSGETSKCNDNDKNDVKGNGISEIDDMFASKRERKTIEKQEEEKADKIIQEQKKRRKEQNTCKRIPLSHDRSDTKKMKAGEWVQDGLGGVFDADGFTGRREETQGLKVYKAHLFNKKGFGTTKDCPFDCDCCYI